MVVIAYDIKDDKRLKKVAKYLESHGIRSQKSVFELDINIRKAKKIFQDLQDIIGEGDKCFLFEIKNKEDIQANTDIERIL
jgi:CRISPR-associated endonuclease Cas2